MMRIPALSSAAAITLLLLNGCHSFTEHSGAPKTGILFLDPFTLELTGSLDGVEGATAICNLKGGKFAVLGNTGVMHIYDGETMALDTSFTVGPPQSAGYGDMTFIPWKNSVYIIGAQGSILEVGVPDGTLRAEITGFGAPARIVSTRTGGHVYVSDPVNQRVHGVSTQTNQKDRTFNYSRVPTVLECNAWGADTLLICTTDPGGIGYMQPGETGGWPRQVNIGTDATDMISSSFNRSMLTAHPNFSSPWGQVCVVDSLFPGYYVVGSTISVPGNPYRLAFHDDQQHLYILSRHSGTGATVHLYHYQFESFAGSADLPMATPVDMIFAADRLVILTY